MTIIVGYAADGFAFVGGDTKRTLTDPVIKLHRWSAAVVFGQAGNALHLSALIGQMIGYRGMFGDEVGGLIKAFQQLYSTHQTAARAKAASNPKATAAGDLLVADAASGGLFRLDFATGLPTALSGRVAGIGVPGVDATAKAEWVTNGPALDEWTVSCVQAHLSLEVDWPVDLLLARPDDPAGATSIFRRLEVGWLGPSDPLFRA